MEQGNAGFGYLIATLIGAGGLTQIFVAWLGARTQRKNAEAEKADDQKEGDPFGAVMMERQIAAMHRLHDAIKSLEATLHQVMPRRRS